MYDLCGQTNVAFTIAQTKRLHPGWEAFKRDCVTDKTKQWMYISPEKVEYFALEEREARPQWLPSMACHLSKSKNSTLPS
jgi:hypothetical protein